MPEKIVLSEALSTTDIECFIPGPGVLFEMTYNDMLKRLPSGTRIDKVIFRIEGVRLEDETTTDV
jgi:hypothetical protein